jgi:SAM-dependent methyltransferase
VVVPRGEEADVSFVTEPLAHLWTKLGSRPYDLLYRRGAPWEGAPRAELRELLETGRLTPHAAGGRRALDLGCGSGADSLLLADHGFEVTAVDFSEVALAKARTAADGREGVRFVQADLFALPQEVSSQQFDLIFDGGTIDDFPTDRRRDLARIVTRLARPGAVLVMWCFCAERAELPWVSLTGPSRLLGPADSPEEIGARFGTEWEVERLAEPTSPFACFWMVRR